MPTALQSQQQKMIKNNGLRGTGKYECHMCGGAKNELFNTIVTDHDMDFYFSYAQHVKIVSKNIVYFCVGCAEEENVIGYKITSMIIEGRSVCMRNKIMKDHGSFDSIAHSACQDYGISLSNKKEQKEIKDKIVLITREGRSMVIKNWQGSQHQH